MSEIICVTNRSLCGGDFLLQLEKIAAARPDRIILREKDMDPEKYKMLANDVMSLCRKYGVKCTLHTFAKQAVQLGAESIHLPLAILRTLSESEKRQFSEIGASCHSPADVHEAECLGASYVTAGHVFATDCKKGLPGRGLSFLSKVVCKSEVPVYGIGGISADNAGQIMETGAAGVCIMSGFMLESMN